MRFYKNTDYELEFIEDLDCNDSQIYNIGNFAGKKIGEKVFFRDDTGFWIRHLDNGNEEEAIGFLNDLNLSLDTLVGFFDEFIIVENKTHNYPLIKIYDFYGYDGQKRGTNYKEEIDKAAYSIIQNNLVDKLTSIFNSLIFGYPLNQKSDNSNFDGPLTMSTIKELFTSLKDKQMITDKIGKNFEKCYNLIENSKTEDPILAFLTIINVVKFHANPMYPSAFNVSYAFEALEKIRMDSSEDEFQKLIIDSKQLAEVLDPIIYGKMIDEKIL